ncbi:MAG: tRNA lysidine(34) synthetase TilS [bacterium]
MKRVSVFHQFLDTVEQFRLINKEERVLIGVSGGADSVCLTDLLKAVARKWRLKLFAIHINHHLRSSAERDEEFVKDLFKRWGIKLTVVRVDVAGYAQRCSLGIEEAARQLRYETYRRMAKRLRCDRVALGHNADDNLETVILNLTRGAGLRGLAGIPIRRDIFVRPLLRVKREAIREYLRAREMRWVEDETNQDVRYRRNLIRQKIVPELKRLNPVVAENVAKLSAILAAEDKFLDFLATRVLERIACFDKEQVLIDNRKINSYNIVLKRRMIKVLLPQVDADTTERLIFLIESNRAGRYSLQGDTEVAIKKGFLTVPIIKHKRKKIDVE